MCCGRAAQDYSELLWDLCGGCAIKGLVCHFGGCAVEGLVSWRGLLWAHFGCAMEGLVWAGLLKSQVLKI